VAVGGDLGLEDREVQPMIASQTVSEFINVARRIRKIQYADPKEDLLQ
jgi:hypothetical protein